MKYIHKSAYSIIFRSLVLMVFALSIFACATPQTMRPGVTGAAIEAEAFKQKCLLVEEEAAFQTRLMGVGIRVAEGGRQMSPATRNLCGFRVAKRSHFPKDAQGPVDAVFGLGSSAKVIMVAPESPAERAGLRMGDEVININGQAIPDDPKAFESLMESFKTDLSVKLAIIRDGETVPIEVNPVICADSPIILLNSTEPQAYADGKQIIVSKGLMRLTANDDELAMVLSHEMAHNIRQHHKMTKKNAAVGAAFGFLLDVAAAAGGVNTNAGFTKMGMQAGGQAYSKEMEAEADYVGLYILANAGYDIHSGPNLFRRLGVASPKSMEAKYATSHPSTPGRFIGMIRLCLNHTPPGKFTCRNRGPNHSLVQFTIGILFLT
jgi:membrane-associated protease RseP (regulator of RpoE activity)